MSAMPDSTSANPEQFIADLQRQLAEREAELAECKAERDEALQRETATAEVLEVINSSPGILAPIFDAILEKALRVCSATFGVMTSHNNGRFSRVAGRGLPAAFSNWRLQHPLETPSGGYAPMLQRVLEGEAVVREPDLMAGEAYRQGNPQMRALVDLGGARSAVTVALRNDHALLGTIMIFRQEVRPFSDKEIRLLQNFAAQAVTAMENARLLNELRQSLEEQTATADVLRIISSSPGELQSVFRAMLENATRICEAKFGILWLAENDGFRSVALHGVPPELAEERRRDQIVRFEPDTPFGRVVKTKRLVHVTDITTEPAYLKGFKPLTRLAELGGGRSLLLVPMLKDDILIGVITSTVRKFSRLPTSKSDCCKISPPRR
jgi:GAF domain-containing protein